MNRGKQWEEAFQRDWRKSFPKTFLYRLHDLTTGYKVTSAQACDYIAYNNKKLYLIELKSHLGKSIPFAAIPQYPRLLQYKSLDGVYPYLIIWFIEQDIVIAVKIDEAEKMVKNGEKSIGLRMLDQKDESGNPLYNIKVIPSEKKRVFLECNYTILSEEE